MAPPHHCSAQLPLGWVLERGAAGLGAPLVDLAGEHRAQPGFEPMGRRHAGPSTGPSGYGVCDVPVEALTTGAQWLKRAGPPHGCDAAPALGHLVHDVPAPSALPVDRRGHVFGHVAARGNGLAYGSELPPAPREMPREILREGSRARPVEVPVEVVTFGGSSGQPRVAEWAAPLLPPERAGCAASRGLAEANALQARGEVLARLLAPRGGSLAAALGPCGEGGFFSGFSSSGGGQVAAPTVSLAPPPQVQDVMTAAAAWEQAWEHRRVTAAAAAPAAVSSEWGRNFTAAADAPQHGSAGDWRLAAAGVVGAPPTPARGTPAACYRPVAPAEAGDAWAVLGGGLIAPAPPAPSPLTLGQCSYGQPQMTLGNWQGLVAPAMPVLPSGACGHATHAGLSRHHAVLPPTVLNMALLAKARLPTPPKAPGLGEGAAGRELARETEGETPGAESGAPMLWSLLGGPSSLNSWGVALGTAAALPAYASSPTAAAAARPSGFGQHATRAHSPACEAQGGLGATAVSGATAQSDSPTGRNGGGVSQLLWSLLGGATGSEAPPAPAKPPKAEVEAAGARRVAPPGCSEAELTRRLAKIGRRLAARRAGGERSGQVHEEADARLVEQIRQATEALVWGERHDGTLFDLFCEHQLLGGFVATLQAPGTSSAVKVQLLQSMAILLQNARQTTSTFYLLSGGRLNALFDHPPDLGDEEVLAYFVTLLKNLALNLSSDSARLLLASAGEEPGGGGRPSLARLRLPIFERSLALSDHWEAMVRTAARAAVLNILRLEDEDVRDASVSAFCRLFAPGLVKRLDALRAKLRRQAAASAASSLDAAATAVETIAEVAVPDAALDAAAPYAAAAGGIAANDAGGNAAGAAAGSAAGGAASAVAACGGGAVGEIRGVAAAAALAREAPEGADAEEDLFGFAEDLLALGIPALSSALELGER